MQKTRGKKKSCVLISSVVLFSVLLTLNSGFVQDAEAQDFTINTFTGGTHYWTSDSGDRYNQSADTLELNFPMAEKDGTLVSYWRFEGDMTDETGTNDGSSNSCSYVSARYDGQGIDCNGAGNSFVVPDDNSLDVTADGSWAITFWVNVDAITTTDTLILHGQWANSGWYATLELSGGLPLIRFVYNAQAGNWYDTDTFTFNTWNHFAFACYNSNRYIYLNGSLQKTSSASCTSAAYGNDFRMSYTDFDGTLDEVRLYNDGISAETVERLHNHGNYKYEIADHRTDVLISSADPISGMADYEPQIHSNSHGDLVLVYGNEHGNQNSTTFIHYSTDNGFTWSAGTTLFTNATIGTGIIDNNDGAWWEYGTYVHNDTLYLTTHFAPAARTLFTKCNIANVVNVTDYTCWQSADGTTAPSEGGGSNGYGYDFLYGADPTIAVQDDDNLMVVTLHNDITSNNNMSVHVWNGAAWSKGDKYYQENLGGVPQLRYLEEGDWVVTMSLTASDSNHYGVATRCPSGSDCTLNASWTAFDGGTGEDGWGYDIVLDNTTYAGGFSWTEMQVTAENYTIVTSIAQWTNPTWGYQQIWFNWWNGTQWAFGTTENDAGVQINLSANIPSSDSSVRQHCINADGYGNIIMMYHQKMGALASEYVTLKWDADTEVWEEDTLHNENATIRNNMVGMGQMAGDQTVSYFFYGNLTDSWIIGSHQGESGTPFWDDLAEGISQYNGNWISASQTMSEDYLSEFTITYDNVSAGQTYIDKIQFRATDDGELFAEYGTDITSGTSLTVTTATWGALSNVDEDFQIRVFLVGNTTNSPTVTSIVGELESSNTAPSITGCPTETLNYREGENIQVELSFVDNVGDTHTWSSDTAWLDVDSNGRTSGSTYVVDNDQTFTVVITLTDQGGLSDTCSFDILIMDDDEASEGTELKFDFICIQISYRELVCEVNNTYGVPHDRLLFTWRVGKNSAYYHGDKIIHYLPDGFVIGQSEQVTLTMELVNNSAKQVSKTKIIESKFIPFWWILVAFLIALMVLMIVASSNKERKQKRTQSKWGTRLRKTAKSIGWVGLFLLALAFIWWPTGTPDDLFTTLPLIMVLGFTVWFWVGIAILVLCFVFLYKFIAPRVRKRLRVGVW
jgi:hypothetical protein